MFKVWAEWKNGQVECVDEFDTKSEAEKMVSEYRMAYGSSARRIWSQPA